MSAGDSSFLETDEFDWLNAFLREPAAISAPSAPISIPFKSPPSLHLSSIPINDSLTLLREKGFGGRRRYQNSTKSSHAKTVQQSKSVLDVGGLPASLRTSPPATPTRRVRTTSIRNVLRSSLVRAPSSSQQEWIYRRPKSPISPPRTCAATAPTHSPISSPTRPLSRIRPAQDNKQSPHWSNVLRSRSRIERTPKGVTLAQLKVDSSVSQSKKLASPVSDCSSPTNTSSSSSSTISSRPQTPTSPRPHSTSPLSLKYNGRKYHRRYQDTSLESTSTSSVNTLTGRLPSSLADSPIEFKHTPLAEAPPPISCLHTPRKNSVGTACTTGSSSKSVKFVELPTVHYASVDYWDRDQEKVDEEDCNDTMGIDVDGMDLDPQPHGQQSSDQTDATEIDIFAIDGPPWMHPEVDSPPESPARGDRFPSPPFERASPPMKRLPSFRRSARSSIPVPVKPRPTISGPMALAKAQRSGIASVNRVSSSSKSLVSMRNSSVDSFKSGGGKSIRSLASLKSLPASLKSSVTLNVRSFRDWFKERLDIGVVG